MKIVKSDIVSMAFESCQQRKCVYNYVNNEKEHIKQLCYLIWD